MPTLSNVFQKYVAANASRSKRTHALYRYEANRCLGDWLTHPLDAISRTDVDARFNSITADHGWSAANRATSLLRSTHRRPCVDHDGLRNPVDLWLAGAGKFHRKARRTISTPAEVQPCSRTGIEASVNNPEIRDPHCFGRRESRYWFQYMFPSFLVVTTLRVSWPEDVENNSPRAC